MATNYSVLSSGLYELPRAEVLCQVIENDAPIGPIIQLGDVDKFSLGLSPQKIQRFRKNSAVRTKAAEIITQIDSTVTFTVYQFTQFIRLLSILGKKVEYSQSAGSHTYTSKAYVGIHYVGHQKITALTIDPVGSETWTLGTHYKIVDAELGAFEILQLPSGVTEASDLSVDYTVGAIAAGSRMKAKVGGQPSFTLRFWVRDVGANSRDKVLYLPKVEVAPSGEVAFIGEDDFTSQEFTGSALDNSEGLGFLIDLEDVA